MGWDGGYDGWDGGWDGGWYGGFRRRRFGHGFGKCDGCGCGCDGCGCRSRHCFKCGCRHGWD